MTDTLIERCTIPPKGWICQRGKGHAGPCAANPLPEGMTESQYWYSRWWDAMSGDEAAQAIATLTAELQEAADIGERDGYEIAVQDIDAATGGDGEFYASTCGDSVDVPVMKQRIIDRFHTLTAENERLRDALWEIANGHYMMIEADFINIAKAALKGQS